MAATGVKRVQKQMKLTAAAFQLSVTATVDVQAAAKDSQLANYCEWAKTHAGNSDVSQWRDAVQEWQRVEATCTLQDYHNFCSKHGIKRKKEAEGSLETDSEAFKKAVRQNLVEHAQSIQKKMKPSAGSNHKLDEYFGIQTNKSRFSVDKELQEVLADEIGTILTQVVKLQAGTADERRAVRAGIMESVAEANIRTLASRLPVPIYTEADLDKGRAFRDSMRQKLVAKLQTGYERKIQELESERNQRSEEDYLNEQHRRAQLLEEYIRRVEARFGSRAPLRFDHREDEDCEDNALYDVDIQGDETVVYVQKSSPLYTSLASSIENQPSLAYALKLMLGSLAYAEHMDCAMDPNNVAIWEDVRHDISAKLHAMLPVLERAMAEQEVDE